VLGQLLLGDAEENLRSNHVADLQLCDEVRHQVRPDVGEDLHGPVGMSWNRNLKIAIAQFDCNVVQKNSWDDRGNFVIETAFLQ